MLHGNPDFSTAWLAARMMAGSARSLTAGGISIAKPNQSGPLSELRPGRTSQATGRPLAAIASRPFLRSMVRGSMSIGVGLVPNKGATFRDTVRYATQAAFAASRASAKPKNPSVLPSSQPIGRSRWSS